MYAKRISLPACGYDFVKAILQGNPVKRLHSTPFRGITRYASQKNGHTVQVLNEPVMAAILQYYEPVADVLAYRDYPCEIALDYIGAKGRRVVQQHGPHYIVFRQDRISLEDWFAERWLLKQAEHNPHKYLVDADGRWHFAPGERFATTHGLQYSLRLYTEVNPVFASNIEFLFDYLTAEHDKLPDITTSAVQHLLAFVACHQGISLDELMDEIWRVGLTIDHVHTLLVLGKLYVDLYAVSLTAQEAVEVFTDEASARAFKLPQHAMNHFEPSILAQELKTAGLAAVKQAMERLEVIDGKREALEGKKKPSDRTLRDWKKRTKETEHLAGYGLLGLITNEHLRGNRNRKLPVKTLEIIESEIKLFTSTHRWNKTLVWGAIRTACEAENLPIPSYETVRKLIDAIPLHEREHSRWGSKAAYDSEPTIWWLDAENLRDGNRPFQIAHLDHFEIDMIFRDSKTGANLGKAYASVMVDVYTREILAIYLSFESSSYRSNMMLLRECVRRHGRLPNWIVVDQGPDFNSIYFELVLALFKVHKRERPSARPRSGSTIERLFDTSNTAFIHTLLGSTEILKDARLVTSSVDPEKASVWTLVKFFRRFEQWAYERYNASPHAALGVSPYDLREHGFRQFGNRQTITAIDFNEGFIFATLPTTKSGKARVVGSRGIKVKTEWYWSPLLKAGAVVEIRYEPFDRGIIFAFVGGQWRLCKARRANLRGLSERYVQMRAEEQRARARVIDSEYGNRASQNAQFLKDTLREEEQLSDNLKLERLKQQESKTIREMMVIDTLQFLLEQDNKQNSQILPNVVNTDLAEGDFVPETDVSPVRTFYRDMLAERLEV